MTLNQLRTFLAVADHGSVRAAAEDLVVTQAAVSASLAALQKSVGVALLAPDGRGLRLTPAGDAYAGYVRRVLGLLDEAGLAAAAAADPERSELRLAAVTTAAEQLVPGLLGGFLRAHQRMGLRLEAGNRDRVRALLDRHQVDLVLTGRPEPGWDVAVRAVRPHALVVVATPELAAQAGDDGLLPWLGRQTWLLREPGSGTRASTDALLAELDLAPPTLLVGSNVAIRESARVGLGVTLVSRDAVAGELAAGRLATLPVPGTPLYRDWYVLAHPGTLPAPAELLIAHMVQTGDFSLPPAAETGRSPSQEARDEQPRPRQP